MTEGAGALTEYWRDFEPLEASDRRVARSCEGAVANVFAPSAAGSDRLAAASTLGRVLVESGASAALIGRILAAVDDEATRAAFVEALLEETRNGEQRAQAATWVSSWVRLGPTRAALSVAPLASVDGLRAAEAIDAVANALARGGIRQVVLAGPEPVRGAVADALAIVGISCVTEDLSSASAEGAPTPAGEGSRPWWRRLW